MRVQIAKQRWNEVPDDWVAPEGFKPYDPSQEVVLPNHPDFVRRPKCEHLGKLTGEVATCAGCGNQGTPVALHACTYKENGAKPHPTCTIDRPVAGAMCCQVCPHHVAKGKKDAASGLVDGRDSMMTVLRRTPDLEYLSPHIRHLQDSGMSSREAIPFKGNGVEVGTDLGLFAESILKHKVDKLVCVDPWENRDALDETRKRLADHGERVDLMTDRSPGAASKFLDSSLDFAYIDGDHSEAAVRADLDAWWPKVKPGGFISGHDFLCINEHERGFGKDVQPAVIDFAKKHQLRIELVVERDNGPWSFIIRKPPQPAPILRPTSDTGILRKHSADPIRWGYGVTTVPERRWTTLPRTLESLAAAGFDHPHLFVDGCDVPEIYRDFSSKTIHSEKVRAYGHWLLSLLELYIRHPTARRYALFQDDMICCKGLREYLDAWWTPRHGYWNLYTVAENHVLHLSRNNGGRSGLPMGWFESNQMGKGALALVFSAEMARQLLLSRNIMEKPHDPNLGWRRIDGAVAEALCEVHSGPKGANPPYREWCHHPSLVQHIGEQTTIVGPPMFNPATGRTEAQAGSGGGGPHGKSPSFMGEEWDARQLLEKWEKF